MALSKGKILAIACLLAIGMGEIFLTVSRDLLYAQNAELLVHNQAPGILVTPIGSASVQPSAKTCGESNTTAATTAPAAAPPPPYPALSA